MIWLVGQNGMLGRELQELLTQAGLAHTATGREVDIGNEDSVLAFGRTIRPKWIVNCAAYTAVDKAESEPDLCRLVNAEGPRNLAKYATRIGARLIHISTDYVFGEHGLRRPLTESDPVGPESEYGASKLAGEEAVRSILHDHIIIRTSWLYGRHGRNFVSTMLRLMKERTDLRIVDDQWGSPTWTRDLSDVILSVTSQEKPVFGTYHFSSAGPTTWFQFARHIQSSAVSAGLLEPSCRLEPCTTADYPTPAKRPAWSVFSTTKIENTYGVVTPKWQESVESYMKELKEKT